MYGGSKKNFLMKNPYLIPRVLMLLLKFSAIIYQKFIESYGMYCKWHTVNHESLLRVKPLSPEKLQEQPQEYKGLQSKLTLGNLDASRDWGFAGDYVEGRWMMQHDKPDDWVLATGHSITVREFFSYLFNFGDLDYKDM